MNSRMSKYDSENLDNKRSEKNKKLYENMYDEVEYSNIQDIANIEKTNEIDLNMIKEMLNKNNKVAKKTEEEEYVETETSTNEEEPPNYDIKQFLDQAKTTRKEIDPRRRHLDEMHYNVLKKFDVEKSNQNESGVSNFEALDNLNDQELSEKMFEDLHVAKTSVVPETDDEEVDKSFYTASLDFKNEDFEGFQELDQSLKKNTVVITVLVASLFILMAGLMIYIFLKIF